MDSGLFSAIGAFLSLSWDFFTGVKVPGTDLSIAAFLVGLFLANLGLRFLFMVLDVSVNSADVERFVDVKKDVGRRMTYRRMYKK